MSEYETSRVNREVLAGYMPTIRPIIPRVELAKYADVSRAAVDFWVAGQVAPHAAKVAKIGELASVINFLKDELSFTDVDVRRQLAKPMIDPNTYEAVPAMDLIKSDYHSLVIQDAIKQSIVE